jgi:hypothetical protein
MEIEKLLKDYRQKASLLELLKNKKEVILKKLNRIPDEVKYCSTSGIIEHHPKDYHINRIVENAGIKSAEIHQDLQAALNIIELDIEELEPQVKTVQILVSALDDTERFIIEKFYFCGWPWYTLEAETHVNRKTLKKRRIEAFLKMRKLMEV